MTNKEKLIATLGTYKKGLCDDCLSRLSGVKPRQQTNQICRALTAEGSLSRQRVSCSECQNYKIVNRRTRSAMRADVPPTSVVPQARGTEGLDVVAVHRWLVALLDRLEDVKGDRPEGTSARIGRLQSKGLLPENVGSCMRTVNTFRNMVVHDGHVLTASEKMLLDSAGKVISEWWESESASRPTF